jgi:hypothetical protein
VQNVRQADDRSAGNGKDIQGKNTGYYETCSAFGAAVIPTVQDFNCVEPRKNVAINGPKPNGIHTRPATKSAGGIMSQSTNNLSTYSAFELAYGPLFPRFPWKIKIFAPDCSTFRR